jgi:hypothetical protein
MNQQFPLKVHRDRACTENTRKTEEFHGLTRPMMKISDLMDQSATRAYRSSKSRGNWQLNVELAWK